jgi:hypothetical protein
MGVTSLGFYGFVVKMQHWVSGTSRRKKKAISYSVASQVLGQICCHQNKRRGSDNVLPGQFYRTPQGVTRDDYEQWRWLMNEISFAVSALTLC